MRPSPTYNSKKKLITAMPKSSVSPGNGQRDVVNILPMTSSIKKWKKYLPKNGCPDLLPLFCHYWGHLGPQVHFALSIDLGAPSSIKTDVITRLWQLEDENWVFDIKHDLTRTCFASPVILDYLGQHYFITLELPGNCRGAENNQLVCSEDAEMCCR